MAELFNLVKEKGLSNAAKYVKEMLENVDPNKPVLLNIEDNSEYYPLFEGSLKGVELSNGLSKPLGNNVFITTSSPEEASQITALGLTPLYSGHLEIIKEMIKQLKELGIECLLVFDVNFKPLFELLKTDEFEVFTPITLLYDLYDINPELLSMGLTQTADKADVIFKILREDVSNDLPITSKTDDKKELLETLTRLLNEATLRMSSKQGNDGVAVEG